MTDNVADSNQPTVFEQTPPPWPVPRQTRPAWSDPFPRQNPPAPFAAQQPPPPQGQPTPPPFPRLSPAPQSAYQPQWPQPVRNRGNIGLVVAAVVLFVMAAVSCTLYVMADRDHDTAVATLAENEKDLANAKKQVDGSTEERSAAEEENARLSDENTSLSACVDAVQHYLWDGLVDPERSAALTRMFDLCQ